MKKLSPQAWLIVVWLASFAIAVFMHVYVVLSALGGNCSTELAGFWIGSMSPFLTVVFGVSAGATALGPDLRARLGAQQPSVGEWARFAVALTGSLLVAALCIWGIGATPDLPVTAADPPPVVCSMEPGGALAHLQAFVVLLPIVESIALGAVSWFFAMTVTEGLRNVWADRET